MVSKPEGKRRCNCNKIVIASGVSGPQGRVTKSFLVGVHPYRIRFSDTIQNVGKLPGTAGQVPAVLVGSETSSKRTGPHC